MYYISYYCNNVCTIFLSWVFNVSTCTICCNLVTLFALFIFLSCVFNHLTCSMPCNLLAIFVVFYFNVLVISCHALLLVILWQNSRCFSLLVNVVTCTIPCNLVPYIRIIVPFNLLTCTFPCNHVTIFALFFSPRVVNLLTCNFITLFALVFFYELLIFWHVLCLVIF